MMTFDGFKEEFSAFKELLRCIRLTDVGSLPIDAKWLSSNEFKAELCLQTMLRKIPAVLSYFRHLSYDILLSLCEHM